MVTELELLGMIRELQDALDVAYRNQYDAAAIDALSDAIHRLTQELKTY